MSAEFWKAIFDWGTVALIGLTFVFGAGALITGKIISDRQDEKLRQFDKGLTAAKIDLGQQQVLVDNANERAAIAETRLLELQKKIQPRHLSKEERLAIKDGLKGTSPREVHVLVFIGAPDGSTYADELVAAINSAGWHATHLGWESSGSEVKGLGLIAKDLTNLPPGTKELQTALSAAHLSAALWRHPTWGSPNVTALLVGQKE
jgi:hypothetical protein